MQIPHPKKETESIETAKGTSYLRRRHFVGGEGSKICQICQWIVVKKLPTERGRGQKLQKFADVLNGWSLSSYSTLLST